MPSIIGEKKYLLGSQQGPTSEHQTKWQPIVLNPRWGSSGRMEVQVQAEKESCCSLGTDSEEISHAASCFSSQPELFPFQQNTCSAPGQMASSAVSILSTSGLSTRDFDLGKVMYFSPHWTFIILIFCWMISQVLTLAEEIWVGDKMIWKKYLRQGIVWHRK